MLQPSELLKAMGGGDDHRLPYGSRREKVKLCGNGVCSDVMSAIFQWIEGVQQQGHGNHREQQVEEIAVA
jgi:DNA (cytosine-5)-methyltransferase 1